jgi:hypothetical protein
VVLEDDATVDAVVRLGGPVLAYIPSNRALLEMRISDGKMLPVVQPAAFFGARSVMVDPEGNPYFAPDTNPARLRAARRAHPDASLWVGIPASLFARWIAAVPVDVQHIAVRWEEYHGFKVRGS